MKSRQRVSLCWLRLFVTQEKKESRKNPLGENDDKEIGAHGFVLN